jgi:hypothetical protein
MDVDRVEAGVRAFRECQEDPEEVYEERRKAAEEEALKPLWACIRKCQFNGTLYEVGDSVRWPHCPNQHFVEADPALEIKPEPPAEYIPVPDWDAEEDKGPSRVQKELWKELLKKRGP